jgi:hypothetical protein
MAGHFAKLVSGLRTIFFFRFFFLNPIDEETKKALWGDQYETRWRHRDSTTRRIPGRTNHAKPQLEELKLRVRQIENIDL